MPSACIIRQPGWGMLVSARFGFATRGQGGSLACTRLDRFEESPHINAKHLGEGFERVKRHILPAALDAANIGAIDARIEGKALLREPLRHTMMAQVPAEGLSQVHARSGT